MIHTSCQYLFDILQYDIHNSRYQSQGLIACHLICHSHNNRFPHFERHCLPELELTR